MKCAKCDTQVTVADSRCPKCNSDLLAFGATVFYEKSKHTSDVSSPATGMVFGAAANELKSSLSGFNYDEKKIFSPALQVLKSVFSRHLSDEEIEKVFASEVLPAVDDLSKDKDNAGLFRKVEAAIKSNLGDTVYEHYKAKGSDVLRILRAGELANELMDKEKGDYDLSIRMFPYFKASEKSCWMHISPRYRMLKDDSLIKELSGWLGNNKDSIDIDNIPGWLDNRKKTLIEVINGILAENEYLLGGSLRTGIALYVLGRTWNMKVQREDLSKDKVFQIDNLLKADGEDTERIGLAENLKELQKMRNERMHKDVEGDEKAVNQSRRLSYECLQAIPEILKM